MLSMNKIIIDGYNFIHAIPDLAAHLEENLAAAREALLKKLHVYCNSRQVKIIVVFDGGVPPVGIDAAHPVSNVQIFFSRSPFKADPLIKRLVEKEARHGDLSLVTEDNDIIRFAKGRGAKILSGAQFNALLVKPDQEHLHYKKKFDHELSDDELAEWLKLFGEK